MLVLIPAYEPDAQLVGLIDQIRAADADQRVLVVDDGSGPNYRAVFAAAEQRGAVVVAHTTNRGKGAALKTGFAHAAAYFPGEAVVCADCDGQHTFADIRRVGAEALRRDRTMVLGARSFAAQVPARSRLGNSATRRLFHWATGRQLQDTQTGLRGYPAGLLAWLGTVPGDRFDYELRVLLEAGGAGVDIVEIPADTIYLDGNASSHFRPVVDSVRVYAPLVRFIAERKSPGHQSIGHERVSARLRGRTP